MPVYMKIAGIEGEATQEPHKGWIEAKSLSSPIVRKVPDGVFGNDAVQKGFLVFGNIFMTRKVDSSSVPLAKQTALGKVYDTIEIHVTTPLGKGEKNLIEYKLSKAILASHGLEVTTGEGTAQSLHETVEINFSKIDWKYTSYKGETQDKQIPGWYDREKAQGG